MFAHALYPHYIWKEVRDLEIEGMPLEEKYERLLDEYLLGVATNYALHKELGTVTKWQDFMLKVRKKMVPSFLVSPGEAFRQFVNGFIYMSQDTHPLSNIELTWVSYREAILRVKNCVILKRMGDVVKNAGLDLNPRFMCGIDTKILIEVFKEFGVDLTWKPEENGCVATAKLK